MAAGFDRHGLLRVVQLNIASLFEPDWDHRRFEIVQWLQELDPDLVCFEEVTQSPVTPNTAGWIAEQFEAGSSAPGRRWHWRFDGDYPTGTTVADGTLFGSAIMSRWPIDEWSYVHLPVPPAVDGAGKSLATAFPWELVHAKTAGLDVFATHLAAAPADGLIRQLQVQFIDHFIKQARTSQDTLGERRASVPPILCGDFNAEPDSDEIRYLCGLTSLNGTSTFWQDAWRVAGKPSPENPRGLTQDWRDNPIAASMNIHAKRIDYIFVGDPFFRRGSGGRVVRADLAFNTPLTGVMASDHRGLCVDIVWPDRPKT